MTERSCDNSHLDVLENLKHIREKVAQAALQANRSVDEITLMAVTKTVDAARINVALDAGVTCIGENRVQEYLSKKDQLHLDGVSRQLIGHLQTNKIKQIVPHVDMIQSVDSVRLAQGISAQAQQLGRVMPVLVEINIGCEFSKSGIDASHASEFLSEISDLSGISVRGLMAIPPFTDNDTEKRKVISPKTESFRTK